MTLDVVTSVQFPFPDSTSATAVGKVGATATGVRQETVREHAQHFGDGRGESGAGQLFSDLQYDQRERPRFVTGEEMVTTARSNAKCNCEELIEGSAVGAWRCVSGNVVRGAGALTAFCVRLGAITTLLLMPGADQTKGCKKAYQLCLLRQSLQVVVI